MAKIYLCAHLPAELIGEFLQAVRDFDMKHDPHHEGKVGFESLTESDWPVEKMQAVLQAISPAPKHTYVKRFDS